MNGIKDDGCDENIRDNKDLDKIDELKNDNSSESDKSEILTIEG